MPIVPPSLPGLLQAYDRLNQLNTELTRAAAELAPAAVRDIVCRAGGLAELAAGPLAGFMSPGSGQRQLKDFGGILQAACPVPPPPPTPGGSPPFTGGQCECVRYRVEFTFSGSDITPFSSAAFGRGPIGPVVNGVVRPGDNRYSWGWMDRGAGSQCVESNFNLRRGQGDADLPRPDVNLTIDSVTRVDGLPDECGDPPAGEPEPRPPIVQPPKSPGIPYIRPDGSPGPDIFIDTRIGPIYLDVDATIKVPVVVSFEGGDIENNVTIPVSVSLPDFNVTFEYGGGGGDPTDPTGPVEPSPPEGICCDPPLPRVEDGEEEDPDQPPLKDPPVASKIIGVIVDSVPVGGSSNASTVFTASPPLLVPRIATVQFEVEFEDRVSISSDTQVKQVTQYVPGPENVTLSRAFVKWEPGWTGSFKYVEEPANRNL